jgi:hypothetical protein
MAYESLIADIQQEGPAVAYCSLQLAEDVDGQSPGQIRHRKSLITDLEAIDNL